MTLFDFQSNEISLLESVPDDGCFLRRENQVLIKAQFPVKAYLQIIEWMRFFTLYQS